MRAGSTDRPAHIALFLSDLALGGAERNIVNLGAVFQGRGHRVDLVLVRRKGPLLADVPDAVNLVELGRRSRISALAGLWRHAQCPLGRVAGLATRKLPVVVRGAPAFVDYLKQHRPDAVLTSLVKNNVAAVWCAAAAETGTRMVIREAIHLSSQLSAYDAPFDRALPGLVRRWYPQADAIVAVSEGVAEDLAAYAGVARDRLTTIHNPVDMDRVLANAKAPEPHAWFAADQPPVLVAAARLAREKDFPTLLQAFAKVRRQVPAHLLILGDGPERGTLEHLAETLGIAEDVEMPGRVDNPHAYFARAAAFVSASAWEGFPNAMLEALACGCPVAATDCPSGPAELLDGGSFGRLVPVGAADALASAIIQTLDAQRDSDRLRARAGNYSLEAAATRYLELMFPA